MDFFSKKIIVFLGIFLSLILGLPEEVRASDIETGQEYDYSDIQAYLDQVLGENGGDFADLVDSVVAGDFSGAFSQMGSMAANTLISEVRANSEALKQVMFIALFAALLTRFASAFSREGIGEMGFYVTYLLLLTLLFSAFYTTVSVGSGIIEKLLDFMKVLIPVFFMAVAYAGGSVTALAFYQLVLLVIGAIQWLFLYILLPLIQVYVSLLMVNSLTKEDFLSRLAGLLKTGLNWSLKTLLGLVLGLNLIQGLILPMVDSVKSSTIRKAMSAIPWVGKGGDAVAQVLLGSGALIKNGIGMAALLVLILLCLTPIVKLGVITLLYQGTAALMQPVSDRRILDCISAVSEGSGLVMKLVLYTLVLFVITVAIICAASNANYYAG